MTPYWCRDVVVEREAELCCGLACLEEAMSWVSQDQEMRALLHTGAVLASLYLGRKEGVIWTVLEFLLSLEVIASRVR